jgi:RNA 2',3'-cyclic 3'-phosphodiesterase
VRAELVGWQATALADPALRPVRADALHITLCFLGAVAEGRVASIAEAVRSVPARPVAIALDPEPSPLPKGRPALYAVGARSPAAVALQLELAQALQALRVYKPEKRAFWPHLTVARVRSERRPPERGQRRGKSRPRRVSEPPGPLAERLTEPFEAVRIALYRSKTKPQGAEYVRLDGVDLPPA